MEHLRNARSKPADPRDVGGAAVTDVTARHRGQIDSLRGIGITTVVLAHCVPDYYLGRFSLTTEMGMSAVYMFFVLGAFLITSQLLTTAERRTMARDTLKKPLLGFYSRRAFRLLPPLYLGLFVAAALNLPYIRHELPWHALFGTNLYYALYPHAPQTSSAGHLWSLIVQEQFYLIWPLFIFLLPRRLLGWAFGSVMLIGAYAWIPGNAIPSVVIAAAGIAYLYSLAIGGLAALAQSHGIDLRRFNWLAIPLLVLLLFADMVQVRAGEIPSGYAALIAHLCRTALLVLLVVNVSRGLHGRAGALFGAPGLQYIGRISYGIYVYHLFILAIVVKTLTNLGFAGLTAYKLLIFALVYSATLAAASISWRWMETPINRYRERFQYRPIRTSNQRSGTIV